MKADLEEKVLECGCTIEYLKNGKHIVICCDEHDQETNLMFVRSSKKTKMKESREF